MVHGVLFTLVAAPVISTIFPDTAPAGTVLHLTGSNFSTVTAVTVAGQSVSFDILDDNNLATYSKPTTADGVWSAVVTNPDGSDSISLTVQALNTSVSSSGWGTP